MKSVLYITQQGCSVHYRERQFFILLNGKVINKVSSEIVKIIYIFGKIELANSMLNYIFRKSIECVFLTVTGKFKGRIQQPNLKQVSLRLMQYKLLNEFEDRRIGAVKNIVKAKLYNQRSLLLRANRSTNKSVSQQCLKLRRIFESVDKVKTIDELMGMEGIGAKYYWEGFRQLLKNAMGFQNRQMHPPPDPVNAALSFGYTLFYNEIVNLCTIEGLDVYIGIFHSIEDRRASLALDLMEEFRTIAIDNMILNMINKKILSIDDFEIISEGVKVYLNESGRAKVIYNLKQRLNEEFNYEPLQNKTTLFLIIKHQIEEYKRFLREQKIYKSFLWY